MSRITPRDPSLLRDGDVDDAPFTCCDNKELIFIRCPACAHIMVLCYECDTMYPDLTRLSHQRTLRLTRLEHRVQCPGCDMTFEDFSFMQARHVDKYLPTEAQVIAAGFGHLLSEERRRGRG